MEIEIVSLHRDELGESPLWDPLSRSLFWIDARRHLVQCLQPDGGDYRQWTMPSEIGSIALCESGRLLVALQAEICYLDPADGGLTPYLHVRADLWAKVTRALYYDLVEMGEVRTVDGREMFGVMSGGEFFSMADAAQVKDPV